MKMYVFDGTPEEISKVVSNFQNEHSQLMELNSTSKTKASTKTTPKQHETIERFVTKQFAIDAVTRIKLSTPLRLVMKHLLDKDGSLVPTSVLCELCDYNERQFAGMMGAFGRRMSNTIGYDEKAHFFNYEWNDTNEEWDYSLPPSVISAFNEIDLD